MSRPFRDTTLHLVEFLPALTWRWADEELVGSGIVRDLLRLAVEFQFTTQALGDNAEAEDLTEWT